MNQMNLSEYTPISLIDIHWSFGSRGKLVQPPATVPQHLVPLTQHAPQLQAQTIYCQLVQSGGGDDHLIFIFQLAFSTIGLTNSCQLSCRIRSCTNNTDKNASVKAINHVWSVHQAASLLRVERRPGHGETVTLENVKDSLKFSYVKCFAANTLQLTVEHPQLSANLIFRLSGGYAAGADFGRFWYNSTGGSQITPYHPYSAPPAAITATTKDNSIAQRAPPDGYVQQLFLGCQSCTGRISIPRTSIIMNAENASPLLSNNNHPTNYSINVSDGFGLFAHATQAIQPLCAARQWSISILFDPRKRAFIHFVRWQTGQRYREHYVTIGTLFMHGQLIVPPSMSNHLQTVEWAGEKDPVSGYLLPQAWLHRWNGRGMQAEMYVELKEMAGRHDVLEWLPGWLRLLVQRLIAKPFIFQWMPSAKCHVCLMNSDSSINNITLEGTAMCELAMLT